MTTINIESNSCGDDSNKLQIYVTTYILKVQDKSFHKSMNK